MARWRDLNDHEAVSLERELVHELHEGHPLNGRLARAVARRDDCDEVAFEIEGSGLCVVHLTWAKVNDAGWPTFKFVQSLPDEDV